METLKFIGWLALGLFLLFILGGLIFHILERRVVPNRYEWLEVLSHVEWKSTLHLRREMEKLKGTSLGGMTVYVDLDQLEEEKLVECRKAERKYKDVYVFHIYEHRLTPAGTRKKLEVDSAQKGKIDLQLQPT